MTVWSYLSIKGINGRELPDKFYCEKPQSCPEIGCQNTKVFKPTAFNYHMKAEHGDPKDIKCTEHKVCRAKEPEKLYNAFTLFQHISKYKATAKDMENKQPCDHGDCRGLTKKYTRRTLKHHKKMDHGEAKTLPCSYHESENADSEEALGQFIKHETPNAHPTEEANPKIVIDETPRSLQIIPVEASENKPVSWKLRKTHCPVVNCRLNKPDAIAIRDLPLHVEDMHGLSRRDPRLRLYVDVICTFPGCKLRKTISQFSLAEHVSKMHNESNAVRYSHEDCKNNPRLYSPEQERLHMYIHERKTLNCNDPGCEDSGLLYNKISLKQHRDEQHIKLFCPFRDCGAPQSSWWGLLCHVLHQHNIRTTLAKVKAAASTAFNVSLPGQLNMEMLSSPADDLTSASERQLEHFLQDHVSKSKVGFAQIDYDQDGVLDDDRSLEFEEKDVEEMLISTEECDEDSEDGDSNEDVSDDSDEFAYGLDPAAIGETYEISAILDCASSSKFSANVRSFIKERNLKKIVLHRWGLTDFFRLHFSSDQECGICCGSGSLRYCEFDCPSGETLSLETTVVLKTPKLRDDGYLDWQLTLDIRCWRCITLGRLLSTLRRRGFLLEKDSEMTECAGHGCSNAPWVGTKYCHAHLVDASSAGRKSLRYFLKQLHYIRDSRKTRDRKRFSNPYLQNGFQIEEPADMFDFFKCGELDATTPSMEDFLGLILDGADNVRTVDNEFAGSFLLQVAFRNARGDLLYKRTIGHGVTVKDLYEKAITQQGLFNVILEPIRRLHGPPSLKLTGESENTRTLTEMFTEIENEGIIQPKHKIAEWSSGRCDYHYIYAAAENAGFTHLMPPVQNSVLCLHPLRKTMPGLFSHSLPVLFYLIDPKSDLFLKAHVADVDTKMLAILLVVFGLKISGREDEFLPYWEKYGDASGGWTKIFFKQWKKKPIEVQSNNHALVLSTVSSKKRKSQSAENVVAPKKTRTEPANTKSLLKKVNTKSRNRNIPTKLFASGSTSRSSRIKPLAVPRKQGSKVAQVPSADAEGVDVSEARQSSRIKAPAYYGGASNEDDSEDFVEAEDEADDESE